MHNFDDTIDNIRQKIKKGSVVCKTCAQNIRNEFINVLNESLGKINIKCTENKYDNNKKMMKFIHVDHKFAMSYQTLLARASKGKQLCSYKKCKIKHKKIRIPRFSDFKKEKLNNRDDQHSDSNGDPTSDSDDGSDNDADEE
jgi:hypothetical protein